MKKNFIGLITKLSSEKTINIKITKKIYHNKFLKTIKTIKNIKAHTLLKNCKPGDIALVTKIKPMSKTKHWSILKLLNN